MRLEKDTKVQRLMHLIRERPAIYAQFCVRQVIYLTERYLGKKPLFFPGKSAKSF